MRATRAIIHLENLRHNISLISNHLRRSGDRWRRTDATDAGERPRICLSVKADGYGHGSVRIARAAQELGVEYLAIAAVSEGAHLRAAGVEAPLLLYSLAIPEEFPELIRHRIRPFVADVEYAGLLDAEAYRQATRLPVHLKTDTGMGRIGCPPEELPRVAAEVAEMPNLILEGVGTHFPAADSADPGFTDEQLRRFTRALEQLEERGLRPPIAHAANSGAVVHCPQAWFDLVRPGILGYGYYPSAEQERPLGVRPVMELESRLVFVKRVPADTPISYGLTYRTERSTWIGTVAAGYADGYNRLLSNTGEVLLHDSGLGTTRRVPVVGRVCMDQFMVDLGQEPTAKLYDRVTLFGPQEGAPTAEDIAHAIGTIPYEVTCNINKRVPRVYVDEHVQAEAERNDAQHVRM